MALVLTKSADRVNTFPGDIVTYSVQIINNIIAPLAETNIVFKDIIPTGETFVPDSFAINTVLQPLKDPNLGVPLPDIGAGGMLVVTYKVLIDKQPAPVILTNMAEASSIEEGSTIRVTYLSNEVVLLVAFVELFKSADKAVALLTDVIIYTVVIRNQGMATILTPVFKDVLPKCLQFISGSVYINGINDLTADPTAGITISDLLPGQFINISFSVKVKCIPCPPHFINTATLKYYIEIIQGIFVNQTQSSNGVITTAALSSFKQLSREEYLTIPAQKPDVEDIINVLADIETTDTKVIKTIQSVSLEGQNLTGFKLIVEGILNQKIEYIATDADQSVHAAHFRVPFSTFIILPSTYIEGTPVNVTGVVEDIYYQLINRRTVFKNITFKITAQY